MNKQSSMGSSQEEAEEIFFNNFSYGVEELTEEAEG